MQIPNPKSRIPVFQAILDEEASARAGWPLLDLAQAFLDGGARLLQVRAKRASGAAFLDIASAIVALAHRAGAAVIVNDRADIAALSGADGVHVGQDDLTPALVRRIVGDGAIVGLSTHTPAQLIDACHAPVSYVAVGPVFATGTKATGYDAIGLERVRAAAATTGARRLPLVAIGGITLDTAASAIAAGATSVAVISDLLSTGDPAMRVREFIERLEV
ncbi:MAG TPA: thiamine phosphate synthase [Vicinamibacterales bacterium]|nr:thiamine phosphate synthase [Vicinamibacterales bacterium]